MTKKDVEVLKDFYTQTRKLVKERNILRPLEHEDDNGYKVLTTTQQESMTTETHVTSQKAKVWLESYLKKPKDGKYPINRDVDKENKIININYGLLPCKLIVNVKPWDVYNIHWKVCKTFDEVIKFIKSRERCYW